jgi:hypothetical protein
MEYNTALMATTPPIPTVEHCKFTHIITAKFCQVCGKSLQPVDPVDLLNHVFTNDGAAFQPNSVYYRNASGTAQGALPGFTLRHFIDGWVRQNMDYTTKTIPPMSFCNAQNAVMITLNAQVEAKMTELVNYKLYSNHVTGHTVFARSEIVKTYNVEHFIYGIDSIFSLEIVFGSLKIMCIPTELHVPLTVYRTARTQRSLIKIKTDVDPNIEMMMLHGFVEVPE